MKSVIAFALLVCAVAALPLDPKTAETTVYENNNIGVGPYLVRVETSDGTSIAAEGTLKNLGAEGEVFEVRGEYKYVGDDGQIYAISYIANENGFQPQGAHIP